MCSTKIKLEGWENKERKRKRKVGGEVLLVFQSSVAHILVDLSPQRLEGDCDCEQQQTILYRQSLEWKGKRNSKFISRCWNCHNNTNQKKVLWKSCLTLFSSLLPCEQQQRKICTTKRARSGLRGFADDTFFWCIAACPCPCPSKCQNLRCCWRRLSYLYKFWWKKQL